MSERLATTTTPKVSYSLVDCFKITKSNSKDNNSSVPVIMSSRHCPPTIKKIFSP